MKELSRIIRNERRRQEMTQLELAEKIGVSSVTMNKIEKGHSTSFNTIRKICEVLGLKIAISRIENVED